VIDDFSDSLSVEDIATACSAVGFNTIPNWVTPFRMLSNGEQFRVRLARALVESTPDRPLVMDEFTSVVDRQVAKIGSHAVQKYARRNDVQFVAISCHEDVEEWLRPDWVFRPATGEYLAGRWVQRRRPELNVEIRPVRREAWRLFAPFHYLTSSVHMSARFFALFVEGRIASIAAIMNQPSTGKLRIAKVSRLVTLPDWQGLGLAFVLVDALGSAYRARRVLLHTYPAHPSLIRAFDRSMKWTLRSRPGESMTPTSGTGIGGADGPREDTLAQGRPCAVFRYVGAAASSEDVGRLIGPHLFREPK
jgi:GNAT superfamily N-acetyltransferase